MRNYLSNLSFSFVMDIIDQKLLEMLQTDCKQTTKALASRLYLSVTAVYERVKKLEQQGIVTKYVAVLDKNKVGKGFVVFCHLKLVQHSKNNIAIFERRVAELHEVLECHHVSGDYDYILKIVVRDMDEYRLFLVNKLTALEQIGSTHSTFVISEVKYSNVVVL